MRFFDCRTAPSPRRVRIFMAEKGIELPTVQVDLAAGEQLSADFRAINPRCTVPVLQLDDGTILSDGLAIDHYLESEYPEPNLMGRDAREQAQVLDWHGRIMTEGFAAGAEALRNHARGFQGRALTGPRSYPQIPELAQRGRDRLAAFMDDLDERLAVSGHVALDRFTMADIDAYVCVDFAAWVKLPVLEDRPHVRRWHEAVSRRPAASS